MSEKIENAAPPIDSSLRSRVLGRGAVKKYFAYSGRGSRTGQQGLISYPEEESAMQAHPLAREIITNDGSSTFLVHGTDQETAQKIVEHGLGVPDHPQDPSKTNLKWTAKMLARHNEAGSVVRNTHGLAYRFDGNDGGESGKYKVVAELSTPNPGTSLRKDQFAGTALEQADGVNIVAHEEGEQTSHGQPYSIPPERIRGIFNVETAEFTENPRFVAVADLAGQTAMSSTVQHPPIE
jgi:hypothetical protein